MKKKRAADKRPRIITETQPKNSRIAARKKNFSVICDSTTRGHLNNGHDYPTSFAAAD